MMEFIAVQGSSLPRPIKRSGGVDAAGAVVDRRAGTTHAPLDDFPGAVQFGDPSVNLGEFGLGEGAAGGSAGPVVW
jgi:hypothetical protein